MRFALRDLFAAVFCLAVFALVFLNKYLWAFDEMILALFG